LTHNRDTVLFHLLAMTVARARSYIGPGLAIRLVTVLKEKGLFSIRRSCTWTIGFSWHTHINMSVCPFLIKNVSI
jgi:hypothetical protein